MTTLFEYINTIPEKDKMDLSRSMFLRLAKRSPDFRRSKDSLNLGKNVDVDDRLLFLYLMSKVIEKDNRTRDDLVPFLIYMRSVSFPLAPSKKFGISIRPDFQIWSMDHAHPNGLDVFKSSMDMLSSEYVSLIKEIFASLPENIPGYGQNLSIA